MHDWQYVLWILGTLAKIDDYEAKAFFYDMSDRIDGFLRYLINRPDKLLFTKNVDALGHVYLEVIEIAKSYPMVDSEI